MVVFGTQIHLVTFIYIMMETGLFLSQLHFFIARPGDKTRKLCLILLLLLMLYNITGGLFPDPKIGISVDIQLVITYGAGLLITSYFPYYFYKVFELHNLRWHVFYGVPLFIFLPSLIFFSFRFFYWGNLQMDADYSMLAPLIYIAIMLAARLSVYKAKYRILKNHRRLIAELAMYFFIVPWVSFAIFGVVENNQLLEILFTNGSIIGVTISLIYKSVNTPADHHFYLRNLNDDTLRTQNFEEVCRSYKLTAREIEIVTLVSQGLTYREIAGRLFISGKTVENHLQHVYEKTSVNNKLALLNKLSVAV